MIPFSEVNIAAETFGVPAETIEKDYVISWILHCLSESPIKDKFIFHGGTAIKRMFFEKHRFSEDIDLISNEIFSLETLTQDLACLSKAKQFANIDLTFDENKIISQKDRKIFFISYNCFNEIIGSEKIIQLDFNMKMDLFGKQEDKNILNTYSDMKEKNRSLNVMSLNTIFANKLGMLFDSNRNEPRDIFDIWFLLNNKDRFNFDIKQICKIFEKKYSFLPSFSSIQPCLNKEPFEKNWRIRLEKQTSNLPDFKNVKIYIQDSLKEILNP